MTLNIKKALIGIKNSCSKSRVSADIDSDIAHNLIIYAKENGFSTRSNLIKCILYSWLNDSDFYKWREEHN
ncbi:hypothetical protein [Paraclostridium bifermentans]|uniref:hypothetical protein n=1 Tax=Paraclostridium bifermentans TaxID=1490 RepID=UPI0025B0AC4B|nr:hypothetical protein [Paraclostridium bifermentans]